MHGRERGGNGYERGMTHDNVLCVAAIAAETGRQLVFTEMKKPAPAGGTMLTVPTQSPNPYPLTGLPDIGHLVLPVITDDFYVPDTAGSACRVVLFPRPETAPHTPHASLLTSTYLAGSGYWPLCHFQYTGGNDLHSTIFFIHKLHR